MGLIIAQALFYFLPAYIANASTIILAHFKILESLNKPIDRNYIFKGQPLFGSTKTYRGFVGGTFFGILIVFLQALLFSFSPQSHFLFLFPYQLPNILLLGFLLGFGLLCGDLIKSFFKRRRGIKSTNPFVPFDQLDFLGALILAPIFFPISWQHITALLLISPLLPLFANLFAYLFGWKKVWW